MESWQMLLAGTLCILIVLGIGIGVLFLTYDPAPSNSDTENSRDAITTDTDLKDLNLLAPNWNLLMSDDSILELSSLRGSFVVVDLMQTGDCIPCQYQTTYLKSVFEDYEGRLEILSLSLVQSDTVKRLAEYKSTNGITWYVGLDTNGVFGSYFNVQSVPTLIIIDDEGYFRWVHVGVWTDSEISATLSDLDR